MSNATLGGNHRQGAEAAFRRVLDLVWMTSLCVARGLVIQDLSPLSNRRMNRRLSIIAAARALRDGSLRIRDLVEHCLQRIERFEPQVQAWVVVDRDRARAEADRLEAELGRGLDRGPLHGIPLGIKDIVDVAGLPTTAGSPLRQGSIAQADAPVVARLKAAGAIVLGKTVTTEFACFDPPPTRNPWNLSHTPGGSSSGSAAAVALGMCLGALGSQTGGSITRPATYCGVAGCKPTFDTVSRAGVVPVSEHLDHVGPLATSAGDLAILLGCIADRGADRAAWPPLLDQQDQPTTAPPRLGLVADYFLEQADAEVAEQTRAAVERMAECGASVVHIPLPTGFDEVHQYHRAIMAKEAAEYHRQSFTAQPGAYGPNITSLLVEGLKLPDQEYRQALKHQRHFRRAVESCFADCDALVTPATTSPAPATLKTTGDPRFNSPWSYAGVPTVSLPCAVASNGMPLGLQLIGPASSDDRLLTIAQWCEQQFDFRGVPPLLAALDE